MDDLFLSYAEEDNSIAMWIYQDLKQTGVAVWRYEEDGEIGVNMLKEVRENIEKSRYFCLLDSPHSRKSDFVRLECMIALEVGARKPDFQLIICLIEKEGDWKKEELFKGQNLTTYINLVDYKNGMVKLCNVLEKCFIPWLSVPRLEDFKEEIGSCEIPIKRKQYLAELYSSFGDSYNNAKGSAGAAESLLNALIVECEKYGANIITPHIALGVLRADSGRDYEALNTFSIITQKFESDPRGWAGVGAAQFHLRDYESALRAYEICHRLILESDNEKHKSRLPEIVQNKAKVLVELGDTERALRDVGALSECDRAHPAIQNVRGEILMRRGEWLKAIPCFETAYSRYTDRSIILNLAECYKRTGNHRKEYEILQSGTRSFPEDAEMVKSLARYFMEAKEIYKAISYFKKAVSISPESIQYRVELALILREIGNAVCSRDQIMQCARLTARSAIEHYYLGYAFYLLGKFERARDEYEIAKEDPLIKSWLYYEDLE
jgi:tetratricopeptide (TPR) repeat protein